MHEAGERGWADVQRDGSWGWSNAGLIEADGRSLLVDTLFDLHLTAEMLAAPAFRDWGEAGRIAVSVETVYRNLDPAHHTPDVIEQFRRMAALEA